MEDQQSAENRRNQVDRYVSGEMVGEERTSFEERMRHHAQLAEQVHLHRDVIIGIELHYMQELKLKLAQSDIAKKKTPWKQILGIAASILLLAGLGIGGYYYLAENESSRFEAYFQPYPNVIAETNRGSSNGGANLPAGRQGRAAIGTEQTQRAMQWYELGEYASAIAVFDSILASNSTDTVQSSLLFYRGIAHLELDQTTQAIQDLDQATENPNERLAEAAQWYLALAYLRAEQTILAQEKLQAIQTGGGTYAEQARELLGEMGG